MVQPQRKLVRIGHHRGGARIGVDPVGTGRIVRERIARENTRDSRIDRNHQRIARERGGVLACAFLRRRHGKYLGGAEHLAKALVLAKVEGLAGAVVQPAQDDGAAIGKAKLIAAEGRKPARIGDRGVIK